MKIAVIAAVLLLVLSGCGAEKSAGTKESSYDPFAFHEEAASEPESISFGYGLVHPAENMRIKYSRDMSLDMWIDNAGSSNNLGFMVFVDGIRQDISIDGGERENMHIFDIAAGEKKTFNVSFEPVAAHNDDTLGICFGVMVDPEFVPETATTVFGNRYSINALDLTLTDVPEDVKAVDSMIKTEAASIPEKVRQEYLQYDESGNVSGNRLEDSVQLLIKKVSGKTGDKAPNSVSASDKLEIQVLGGSETEWRVSMYADHKLIPAFNDSFYADMQAGVNKMSSFTVDMSKLELPTEDYGTIYCIAVPTNGGRLVKSHTMIIEREEKDQ